MAALAGFIGWLLLGPDGIAWAAAAGALTIALSPRISPRWVLRALGALEVPPWQAPHLHEILELLARRAGLVRAPRLFYVPTRVLNAFAVGRPDDAAIAVTDGLLRALDWRELAGVLAHEVSHIRANDVWVMTLADIVGRLTVLLSLFGQGLLLVLLPVTAIQGSTLPLVPLAILIFAPTISAFLQLALSRTREYSADLGAVELTGDPHALASALDKLERLQGGWMERMFMSALRIPKWLRTHPPTEERIRRLLELAAQRVPASASWSPDTTEFTLPDFPEITHRPRWHWNGLWY
jgi:heat shock protein HtpX